jgi:crotonobetainyl-CoA:carnitine CoA-transferase CaiB-like acyl-CoA transferase
MICANFYANAEDAIRFEGKPHRAEPDVDLYGTGALNRLYRCAGPSWVFLACPFEHEWQALCQAIERPGWLDDMRFCTASARAANDAALIDALQDVFATAHADDWERRLADADVACARADAANVARFAIEEPSNIEQGFTVAVDHATHGPYLRHGALMQIAGTKSAIHAMCEIGEHTRPILRELGYADADIDDLRNRSVIACHGE